MSDLAVSIRNVSKAYTIGRDQDRHITLAETILSRLKNPLRRPRTETFWALKDITFDIKKGDVVGIVGRNGAGKSTLLKILSRITEPTTGQIELFGRVGSLLEVGTGFHPELTGRENVFLNGAILGMTKAEIRNQFDAIVDFAGVEKFLDTPVKRYSSGMYVRLAFAVAAHLNPEILIVDEVLAVGDSQFQKKCIGKMKDVAGKGRTVLFVSHNMGAVRALCNVGVLLNQGTVENVGTADEVVDSYMKTANAVENVIALADQIRAPSLGTRLRMTSLFVNNGQPVLHDQPLTIRLEFKNLEVTTDVTFGIGFATLDGTRLITVESESAINRADFPAGGGGWCEIFIERFLLGPGQYVIDVGARSAESSGLDYVPACVTIDVLAGPTTPPALAGGFGGVRLPAQWEIRSSNSADRERA